MSDDKTGTVATAPATGTGAATATTPATGEERYIYLGPNRLRDGLQANQVYIGKLPEFALEKLEPKFSLIRQLFAPVEKITEYQQAVQTKGTPQYVAYMQMLGVNE